MFYLSVFNATSAESFGISTPVPAGVTGTDPSPGPSEQGSSLALKEIPSWLLSFIFILYVHFEQTNDEESTRVAEPKQVE